MLYTGQMVYAVRERCGRQLAMEASVEADIVSTVPDSATPAALGYAQQVKIKLCVVATFFEYSFYLHIAMLDLLVWYWLLPHVWLSVRHMPVLH